LSKVTTIFTDVGGVLLTNGWGHESRQEAARLFHLDWNDFESRHNQAFPTFEAGRTTMDEYLNQTVFAQPRSFTHEDFAKFMYAQSKEFPESSLALLRTLAASEKYLIAALNNEPRELNQYRIDKFCLHEPISLFFSSCFVGLRKPDAAIYRLALQVTQRAPEECIFMDDRAENLEAPRELGINTIHFQNVTQLRADLQKLGVEV
jgi:putative hydrolase of the HAD superfamily